MAGYGEGSNLPFGKEWRVQPIRIGSAADLRKFGANVSFVPEADIALIRWIVLVTCRRHRWRLRQLKLFEHNQRVNIAERGVPEGKWQSTYHLEAKGLPEGHGTLVGADDEIKLHCAEAA